MGGRPAKDHKDDKGTGESLLSGKTERAETTSPEEEKAQGQSHNCEGRLKTRHIQALSSAAQ